MSDASKNGSPDRPDEPALRSVLTSMGFARKDEKFVEAADLALNGHNSTKERARRELETLIVRLGNRPRP